MPGCLAYDCLPNPSFSPNPLEGPINGIYASPSLRSSDSEFSYFGYERWNDIIQFYTLYYNM
jgi:hypothetical protein